MKPLNDIKTRGEAIDEAIEFQNWASEQNLSYSELADWQARFEELAKRFDLEEEFKENGVY